MQIKDLCSLGHAFTVVIFNCTHCIETSAISKLVKVLQ